MEVTVVLVAKLRTVIAMHCASLKTEPDRRSCGDVVGAKSGQSQHSDLSIGM